MATITIEVQDDLAQELGKTADARSKLALEALTIEAHRQRRLGSRRLAQLLNVSHIELLDFLQKRAIPSNITADEALEGYNAGGRFLRS